MATKRGFLRRVVRLWEATQVDLHGQYSPARLLAFESYFQRTSWRRALFVCCLTPMPSVLFMVLVDLMPLEPPERGAHHSPIVWTRAFISKAVISLCVTEQYVQHVPGLSLSWLSRVIIATVSSGVTAWSCYRLSDMIGYPLPFMMIIGTAPWSVVFVPLTLVAMAPQIRRNRQLFFDFVRYHVVAVCQVLMTVAYPLFNHGYLSCSAWQQTAFVLVLPVLKLGIRNWISRGLIGDPDATPEAVVFNIEVYHSLFVSLCMQRATSPSTIVALVAVDFIQALLTIMDINAIMARLQPIVVKIWRVRRHIAVKNRNPVETERRRQNTIMAISNQALEHSQLVLEEAKTATGQLLKQRPMLPQFSNWLPKRIAAQTKNKPVPPEKHLMPRTPHVTPVLTTALPPELAALTDDEQRSLVHSTQKIMYITEFTALIEYTEVIMPMIYNFYLVVMYHLPNRRYYPFLAGMTQNQLVPTMVNVMIYASLEFASFVLLSGVLWWKLRLPFVHQLAFVLETQQRSLQSKLLLWVIDIMQNSIIQLGADYTFKFAWLKKNSP